MAAELRSVVTTNDTSAPPAPYLTNKVTPKSKSRSMAKKMGGGQKGVWSKAPAVIQVPKVDAGDPNFDSEGEENVILVPSNDTMYFSDAEDMGVLTPKFSLTEAKKRIIACLSEYFVSGDVVEVVRTLKELDSCAFYYEVVKRAITLSLEKHEKEREMVSRLLSELYPDVLTTSDIQKGFKRLFEAAGDLELDTPNARTLLATFLARAVVDEILPPSFLLNPMVMKIGDDIVESAKKKLSIHHGAARLEKGWGPGDGRPVEELKVAIDQLMQEYIISEDLAEASRCVQELHVPDFHHEVVKRAVTNGMETGPEACVAVSSLLDYLVREQVFSQGQIIQGFDRLKLVLSDLKLDVPAAPAMMEGVLSRGIVSGIIPTNYGTSM